MARYWPRLAVGFLIGAAVVGSLSASGRSAVPIADTRARLPQDEIIYFVMPDRFENGDVKNDRGGQKGDRLKTGYDPAAKGYFHGGDLKGLTSRLDYIQGMGVTAIWLTPIFKNKVVQGPKGDESAGYHGYWITDFTSVDPHLGTNADFKAFVDAAHARGMKVYMDIIANHTADVIQPVECVDKGQCDYRSRADYPYQRKGGVDGAPINPGFNGDADASVDNWAKLTDPNYAFTVRVPKAEAHVKKPEWLNDPIYYHNRGNSAFKGESSTMGDFVGLDDLATENPRVVRGLIDIYAKWIDDFGIDGFRVDTQQHVNPEFWAQWAPAIVAHAKQRGIPNFTIFGENFTDVMEPGRTALRNRVDKMPNVLDFPFARAMVDTVGGNAAPSELARLFAMDALYEQGEKTAQTNPTFLGNHDAGRFSMFVRMGSPKADADEQLDRVMLGHAMMLTLRGVPTIYYGDEQGFVSDGGDQAAREDMFPSKVAVYNDNKLIGTGKTTADANWDTNHPLYRTIALLSRIRSESLALRRGLQKTRFAAEEPGLFAVSRFDPDTGKEYLLLFNTSTKPISQNVEVDVASREFTALAGQCATTASAPGSVRVTLAPLAYAVCAAK
ncbi:alpha-amylase family glycosyl hydrolase [Sphingomonas jaspsi]|uniref:alpha-amylase family glycosyl hydrolase n=1 Tax=Sphingomonas jaspsi TaxID=392409 RepID=UPI0004AF3BE1|nr:alpha-amylase family glycosyl hydrolase [Sphingomonas jaspsi]